MTCLYSLSPSGPYNVSIGNLTWKTKCIMKGIRGCGPGVWELIMKVKSSKVFTSIIIKERVVSMTEEGVMLYPNF